MPGHNGSAHRYLIYLDRAVFTWSANKRVSFYKVHTSQLYAASYRSVCDDKPLLKLVDMHLLKGDNKKLTSAF